jgi:HAD superfamily hydrolase (TIGR01509 family)
VTFPAIFFDMDGTLVDTEPYWLIAERSLMAEFGHEWSLEDQKHCLGGPLPRVGAYMFELAKSESPEFFVRELVDRVESQFFAGLNFMPGARELMEEIYAAGIPMGLVSASPRNLVDATLRSLDHDYFIVSISSNEVSESKPNPESYLKAAAALGVEIGDCLILEDSRPGIAAAQASGALVLAIPHLVEVAEHPRTLVVDSLVDLNLEDVATMMHERISQ